MATTFPLTDADSLVEELARFEGKAPRTTPPPAPRTPSAPSARVSVRPLGVPLGNPDMRAAVEGFTRAAAGLGYEVRLTSGDRSAAQQRALYARRASNRYPVARPGTSNHEKGLAVDLNVFQGGRKVSPRVVAEVAAQHGLRWMGDDDEVHFDFRPQGARSGAPARTVAAGPSQADALVDALAQFEGKAKPGRGSAAPSAASVPMAPAGAALTQRGQQTKPGAAADAIDADLGQLLRQGGAGAGRVAPPPKPQTQTGRPMRDPRAILPPTAGRPVQPAFHHSAGGRPAPQMKAAAAYAPSRPGDPTPQTWEKVQGANAYNWARRMPVQPRHPAESTMAALGLGGLQAQEEITRGLRALQASGALPLPPQLSTQQNQRKRQLGELGGLNNLADQFERSVLVPARQRVKTAPVVGLPVEAAQRVAERYQATAHLWKRFPAWLKENGHKLSPYQQQALLSKVAYEVFSNSRSPELARGVANDTYNLMQLALPTEAGVLAVAEKIPAVAKFAATAAGKRVVPVAARMVSNAGENTATQLVRDLPENLTPEERAQRLLTAGAQGVVLGEALHGAPRVVGVLAKGGEALTRKVVTSAKTAASLSGAPSTLPTARRGAGVAAPRVEPETAPLERTAPRTLSQPSATQQAVPPRFAAPETGAGKPRLEGGSLTTRYAGPTYEAGAAVTYKGRPYTVERMTPDGRAELRAAGRASTFTVPSARLKPAAGTAPKGQQVTLLDAPSMGAVDVVGREGDTLRWQRPGTNMRGIVAVDRAQAVGGGVPAPPPAPAKVPSVTMRPAAPKAAAPAAIPPAQPASVRPGRVVEMPTSSIEVDAQRFQYKIAGVGADGVTAEMKGVSRWDRNKSGVVLVWQDPTNRKTYVVNGHHRFELAKRLGVQNLDVRFIEAATDADARFIGAAANIAEGRGTAIDAAKLFRERHYTPAQLAEDGISVRGKIASDGLALAALDDGLWRRVTVGQFPESRAVAIGRALPDPAEQRALVGLLEAAEARGKRLTDAEITELARQVKAAPTVSTSGGPSLFGEEEITQNLALEKAQLGAWVKGKLSKDQKLFGYVSKGTRAGDLARGGNSIDVAQSREIADAAGQTLELFDRLSTRSGAVSEALNDAARRLAAGEDTNVVRVDLYNSVRAGVESELRAGQPKPGAQPRGTGATAGSESPVNAAPSAVDRGGRGGAPAAGVTSATASAATPAPKPAAPPSGRRNLARNFRAGQNNGQVVFRDPEQMDLYDLGARMRRQSLGGQDKAHQAPVGDIDGLRASIAQRLGTDEATVSRLASEVHADVKAQLKGIRDGEERAVADNVARPATPAKSALVAPPAQDPVNPFAAKAAAARAEANRLMQPTAAEAAMGQSFPLGGGYARKGESKAIDRAIDRAVERAVKAQEALKKAERLEAQARAFDAGEIDATGRKPSAKRDAAKDRRTAQEERHQAAVAAREGKEPWQVRGAVYSDSLKACGGRPRQVHMGDHQAKVAQALQDGRPVPAEVLADYPDLQPNPSTPPAATRKAAAALKRAEAMGEFQDAARALRNALTDTPLASGAGAFQGAFKPEAVEAGKQMAKALVKAGAATVEELAAALEEHLGQPAPKLIRAIVDAYEEEHGPLRSSMAPREEKVAAVPSAAPREARPTPAKATGPARAAAYAGSINLDRLDASPEIKQLVRETVAGNQEAVTAQRRGVRSQEATAQAAEELLRSGAISPETLRGFQAGKALNAEELHAVATLHVRLAEEVRAAEAAYRASDTSENLARLLEATAKHRAVVLALEGASTEAGRALSMMRRLKDAYSGPLGTPVEVRAQALDPAKAPTVSRGGQRVPVTPDMPEFGATNKLFTAAGADAARERLRGLKVNLNAGLPVDTFVKAVPDLVELGGYYVEGGLRAFGPWSARMMNEFGLSPEQAKEVWGKMRRETVDRSNQLARPHDLTEEHLRKVLGEESLSAELLGGLAKIPDGDVVGLVKFLRSQMRMSPAEAFHAYRKSSLTSGTGTHLRNFVSTALNAPLRSTTKASASVWDAAIGVIPSMAAQGRTHYLAEALPTAAAVRVGLREGLRDFKQMIQHGVTEDLAARMELPMKELPTRDLLQKGPKTGRAVVDAVGGTVNKGLNLNFRLQGATDAFNWRMFFQAERHAAAMRMALNEAAAAKKAGNPWTQATREARIAELLDDPAVLAEADESASYWTFHQEPSETMLAANRLRRSIPGGAGEFGIPFFTTPANVLRQTIRYVPGANVPGIYAAIRSGNRRLIAERLGEATTGGLILATLSTAVPAENLTGAAPQKEAERSAFYANGRQPYSVKIGDRWLSYQGLGAITTLFSAVAAAKSQKWGEQGDLPAHAGRVLLAVGRSFKDQSALTGLSDLLELVDTDDPKRWNRFVGGTAGSLVPFSGALRSAGRATDPLQRDPQSIVDFAKRDLPVVGQRLPARVSPLGEPQRREPAGAAALQPFWVGTDRNDPVAKELGRLEMFPGKPAKTLREGGQEIPLTAAQQREFGQARGQAVRDELTRLFGSADYRQADDEGRKRLAQDAIRDTSATVGSLYRKHLRTGGGQPFTLKAAAQDPVTRELLAHRIRVAPVASTVKLGTAEVRLNAAQRLEYQRLVDEAVNTNVRAMLDRPGWQEMPAERKEKVLRVLLERARETSQAKVRRMLMEAR